MAERRYSREEMDRILEIASESGGQTSPPGTGDEEAYTLAEIQSIAAEVDIAPERVAKAANSLRSAGPIPQRVAVATYQAETRFPRRLTPEQLLFAAQEAELVFGGQGSIRNTADYAEWHSEEAGVFVGIVNEGDGARARVIVDRAAPIVGGALAIGFLGVAAFSNVLAEFSGVTEAIAAGGIAGLTGGAVWGWWRWRRKSVLARIEQLLRQMNPGHARPD